MKPLVISGTDTGIGKTVVAAILTLALDAIYWKPIQSGTADGTDTETVAALTGLGQCHFRREQYALREALSPHRAAELDGVEIRPEELDLPGDIPSDRWLVVEGAGGVLVPINRHTLQVDLFARWRAPVVLCARTSLGTINHTLLSIEALRNREIRVVGIVFIGDPMPDTERTILAFGKVTRLGHLPKLPRLAAPELADAFCRYFDKRDFAAIYEH